MGPISAITSQSCCHQFCDFKDTSNVFVTEWIWKWKTKVRSYQVYQWLWWKTHNNQADSSRKDLPRSRGSLKLETSNMQHKIRNLSTWLMFKPLNKTIAIQILWASMTQFLVFDLTFIEFLKSQLEFHLYFQQCCF